MKIWTSEHVFNDSWETVVKAAWRKYPNPFNPAVEGIDVVEREVDKRGVLRSHRLMATRWGFPDWATAILGKDSRGYGSEHSEVDPKKKSMILRSRNLTFLNVITIDETLQYAQHPKDKSKTLLTQQSVVTVKGVPLSSYLESVVLDTISGNASKGRQAMEFVIDKMKTEAMELQQGAKHTMESMHILNKDFSKNAA